MWEPGLACMGLIRLSGRLLVENVGMSLVCCNKHSTVQNSYHLCDEGFSFRSVDCNLMLELMLELMSFLLTMCLDF